MNWSQSEVNSIKIELSRKRYKMVERPSNRIGVDQETIRRKIKEIEMADRIGNLAKRAKERISH